MSHDDPAHDPHLDAALRHAPDRDDAPPPALSRAILEAARAATTPARPWWRRWLEVQPMQWAGVAAGLLVAVLGGRLWWDNPPELREPAPAPAQQSTRSEAPTAPPARAPAVPPAAAPAEAASPAPDAAQETAGVLRPAPMREARKAAPAAPPRPVEERQAAAAADKAVAAARPAPPAPAPAAATQAAPAAAAAPATNTVVPAEAPRGLVQDTRRQQEAELGRLSASAPRAEASLPATRLAPAGSPAARGSAAGVEPPGVQRLRHAAEAASGWSWESRAPQATADAPNAPLTRQAWLQQLLQASAGRWVRQPGTAQPPGESLAWIGTWREDGELRAIVSLQGRRLWWREPDGSTWTATLDPGAAQALALPPS